MSMPFRVWVQRPGRPRPNNADGYEGEKPEIMRGWSRRARRVGKKNSREELCHLFSSPGVAQIG